MKIEITEKDETIIIFLNGRLDAVNVKEFETVINPFLEMKGMSILIDCDKLVYICSSGLRGFMNLLKAMAKNNGTLVVKSLNSDIKKIFEMTGFSSIFTIED